MSAKCRGGVTTSPAGPEPRLPAEQALSTPDLWPFINPRALPTEGPPKTQPSPTLGSPSLLKYLTPFLSDLSGETFPQWPWCWLAHSVSSHWQVDVYHLQELLRISLYQQLATVLFQWSTSPEFPKMNRAWLISFEFVTLSHCDEYYKECIFTNLKPMVLFLIRWFSSDGGSSSHVILVFLIVKCSIWNAMQVLWF